MSDPRIVQQLVERHPLQPGPSEGQLLEGPRGSVTVVPPSVPSASPIMIAPARLVSLFVIWEILLGVTWWRQGSRTGARRADNVAVNSGVPSRMRV